jgi:hypothetical protein
MRVAHVRWVKEEVAAGDVVAVPQALCSLDHYSIAACLSVQ